MPTNFRPIHSRPRRILLSGYYGFANAGDEAVLAGLILSLRTTMPNAEMTVLSSAPRQTERLHGVRAAHRYRPAELLPALARTDLLISGGGSLLQDVTSAHGIFYYLAVVRLAQQMGKRTMFGAQGIGPLQRPRTRRWVAAVANRLDAITVRDPASADLLRDIGVSCPPVEVVADPALLLGSAALSSSPHVNSYGVALRPWHGQNDLAARLATACAVALPDAEAVVFPMQPQTDTIVGEQFTAQNHQSSTARLVSEGNPGALAQEMARCEMMIGMRLHALILAAAGGVPSVALSYDPKVAAFMAQSGQADAIWDLADAGQADALPNLLEQCWAERGARADSLRSRLPQMRALAQRTAEVAASLLAQPIA